MSNILPGQVGIFSVVPVDTNGKQEPVTGTAKITDYTSAYVVATPNANEYMIAPKITIPAGQSVTVSVDFSATASDGSKLPAFSGAFTLMGAAAPPPAVQLVLQSSVAVAASSVTVPKDPGSDTIAINVGTPPVPPPPPPPPPPAV